MNILITYAGGIAGQSIIKSLRKSKYNKDIKIYGLDCDSQSPSLKWCEIGLICPKSETDEYKIFIRNLIEKEKIDLYIPTGEEDLSFLSSLKNEYKSTTFYVSDTNVINLCQDKYELYEKCKNHFECPYTSLDILTVPYFEKPRKGRGSVGARLVSDSAESYKKQNMIYQEYLPGEEWTVDVLSNLNNEILNITPRKRLMIKSGISTQARIELNQSIIDISTKLVSFLNIKGPSCIQYKFDSKNILKLVEINPRFGGGIIFTTLAGVNQPEMIIDDFYKKQINKNSSAKEISISRFWEEQIL